MTLDMTDIKAVWCSRQGSRRNIEEESGSLILYTQNPYVMMMTWDHGQSSSRRGFVLSPTPSPHPMFPIPIPWKFKQKKNKTLVDSRQTRHLHSLSLSLLFFSSSPAGLYCASTNTLLLTGWMEQQHSKGEKKSNLLYCTVLVCIVVHIYIVG